MHVSASISRTTRFALTALLAAATSAALAQGPPGHRDDHRPGPPPPQHDNRPGPHRDDHPDFHFQNGDRDRFARHYQSDANRWRNRHDRPRFSRGQAIPRNYVIRPVPTSYYRGAPPPPPGYRYGYYDGYVVTYNPTTRIIADVLDLITGN